MDDKERLQMTLAAIRNPARRVYTMAHAERMARTYNARAAADAPLFAHAGLLPAVTAEEVHRDRVEGIAATEGAAFGRWLRARLEDDEAADAFLRATGRHDLVAEARRIYPPGYLTGVLSGWTRRVLKGRPVLFDLSQVDPLRNRLGVCGIRQRHAAVMEYLRRRTVLL